MYIRLPILLAFLVLAQAARAELIALDIREREPFAQGKSFGETGPYEMIVGIARFEVDPKLPANRAIVDLDLAPRNAKKKKGDAARSFRFD